MSEEQKYIEKIKVEKLEIMDDTPEEEKVNYIFKLLANNIIEKENNNLDMKTYKKDFKDAGFEPARLVEAYKYLEDGKNKKMEQAEIIEEYMQIIKNQSDELKFENKNIPIKTSLDRLEEVKEAKKHIKDKAGEIGVDFKALEELAKKYVDKLNPNKKTKEPNIILEGLIEEYEKMIS